jgi:Zn finger protein HypA/HybF involved in hydrogenase expression
MRGNDMFGKGMSLKAEVTNGDCPLCQEKTVFVSLYTNVYRCTTCGGDTEQLVNGVIKYIPLGNSTGPTPKLVLERDGS